MYHIKKYNFKKCKAIYSFSTICLFCAVAIPIFITANLTIFVLTKGKDSIKILVVFTTKTWGGGQLLTIL